MPVNLLSSGGGTTTLTTAASASNYTLTLPAGTGTAVVNNVSSAIVSGTAVSPTGTATVDFTGIPSWVKRVTVSFFNLAISTTTDIKIQVGSSAGGIQTTGYLSGSEQGNGGLTPRATTTSLYASASMGGNSPCSGHIVLTNTSGNNWVASGIVIDTGNGSSGSLSYTFSSGAVSISAGALDRVRIFAGAGSFNAGSLNILYE